MYVVDIEPVQNQLVGVAKRERIVQLFKRCDCKSVEI